MHEDHELLDLVDENDTVIGEITRLELWSDNVKYARFVAGFLVNQEGLIWVPTRSHKKRQLPGALDWSFAGHVGKGESYRVAAERELAEELNITAPLQESIKLTPKNNDLNYFVQTYLVTTDDTPEYNTDDFESGRWMTLESLRQELYAGTSAKQELMAYITSVVESSTT